MEFPGLRCEDGDTETLIIKYVPSELNGWYVACLYKDANGGYSVTEGAPIKILS